MQPHQRVNKFPKASALTLKANLWSNYARMQVRLKKHRYRRPSPLPRCLVWSSGHC